MKSMPVKDRRTRREKFSHEENHNENKISTLENKAIKLRQKNKSAYLLKNYRKRMPDMIGICVR